MAAFTAQLPMGQLGAGPSGPTTTGSGLNATSRATITHSQKSFLDSKAQKKISLARLRGQGQPKSLAVASAASLDATTFAAQLPWPRNFSAVDPQVAHRADTGRLPAFLQRLTDPEQSADFPPAHKVNVRSLDNRELDKLVAALGRNKSTWRRALQLHEWLLGLGHSPDDRLCTTLMRVCSQHGQSYESLKLYDWMRAPKREGGAGLKPTVYTYTGAMRAALVGNLPDRALKVWDDAVRAGCELDCRLCTTLIEVCTRKGLTERALGMYDLMRDAPPCSKMAPSVHAYTAAMRAAAEGGVWRRALDVWRDMQAAGCPPSGHAYAAAISACAAGGAWRDALRFFSDMEAQGIKPDVVSCTALATALAADGQWQLAQSVIDQMHRLGVKPNVRTFTALVTAMGNAGEWDLALATIERMRTEPAFSHAVEPNAYTYSALIKTMGEQGEWQKAEQLFDALEAAAVGTDSLAIPGVTRDGQTVNGDASTSGSPSADAAALPLQLQRLRLGERTPSQGSLGSLEFGEMPTALAEEVLNSNSATPKLAEDALDGEPPARSPASPFSFFSSPSAGQLSERGLQNASLWTCAAVNGLPALAPAMAPAATVAGLYPDQWLRAAAPETLSAAAAVSETPVAARCLGGHSPLNEVVCGAIMMAYERAGKWEKAVSVLQRARNLGIEPNTVMLNTAISALGKGGCWEAAESLFASIAEPDSISYETMVTAYGLAGQADKAEAFFASMCQAGHVPRDYAFCGLIAAHSATGDWAAALGVRQRMQNLGCQPSVHVYNALIAICELDNRWDQAMTLSRAMQAEGVASNEMTHRLLKSIGKGGVTHVQGQQVAAAAVAAAVAAAGSIFMRVGIM